MISMWSNADTLILVSLIVVANVVIWGVILLFHRRSR